MEASSGKISPANKETSRPYIPTSRDTEVEEPFVFLSSVLVCVVSPPDLQIFMNDEVQHSFQNAAPLMAVRLLPSLPDMLFGHALTLWTGSPVIGINNSKDTLLAKF